MLEERPNDTPDVCHRPPAPGPYADQSPSDPSPSGMTRGIPDRPFFARVSAPILFLACWAASARPVCRLRIHALDVDVSDTTSGLERSPSTYAILSDNAAVCRRAHVFGLVIAASLACAAPKRTDMPGRHLALRHGLPMTLAMRGTC